MASLSCCVACGEWAANPDGFTELDLAVLSKSALVGAPADPGNEFLDGGVADEKVRALGQALFFSQSLAFLPSGDAVACTDCHSPKEWFSDPRARNAVSTGLGTTRRNSPSLVNVGFYQWFSWTGAADSVWGQSHHAYTSPATMAGSPAKLVASVRAQYANEYLAAFGEAVPGPAASDVEIRAAYVKLLKAWGAYLSQLVSRRSPFDRYVGGERDAMTQPQVRGLKLFIGKAGCIECHRGPTFTDNSFRSIGIGQRGDGVPSEDLGRFGGLADLKALGEAGLRPPNAPPPPEKTEADKGQFRVKALRNVAKTGPYFHAGQVATLRDVVWLYNQGGDHDGLGAVSPFLVPLGLSDDELGELEAFLGALTGEEVDARFRCDSSKLSVRPLATYENVTVVQPNGSLELSDGGLVTTPDGGYLEQSRDATGLQRVTVFGTTPIARDFEACP